VRDTRCDPRGSWRSALAHDAHARGNDSQVDCDPALRGAAQRTALRRTTRPGMQHSTCRALTVRVLGTHTTVCGTGQDTPHCGRRRCGRGTVGVPRGRRHTVSIIWNFILSLSWNLARAAHRTRTRGELRNVWMMTQLYMWAMGPTQSTVPNHVRASTRPGRPPRSAVGQNHASGESRNDQPKFTRPAFRVARSYTPTCWYPWVRKNTANRMVPTTTRQVEARGREQEFS
jgi:hypothetical protein